MNKHTHIGIYGIAINDGKILLVKKQRGPYTGKWDLPGGGVQMGENSIETLNRELLEECGYRVKDAKLADVLNNRIIYTNDKRQLEELTLLSIIYLVTLEQYEYTDNNMMLRGIEDVSDSQWFDINEMIELDITPIADFAKRLIGSCYKSS